ncbi:hypothetical protein CENSYa_1592 [Cenarchaeum symbiosum A]|uniref:Uncharacterized protein n=1 Tax=Cenarchaeum symbiosum (strain A) TaxID=414004 RepID=A0RXZ5_CENSY|nr:hypothetical protein CENSYa_1592 [Cenarchaeum symbiosum A]
MHPDCHEKAPPGLTASYNRLGSRVRFQIGQCMVGPRSGPVWAGGNSSESCAHDRKMLNSCIGAYSVCR